MGSMAKCSVMRDVGIGDRVDEFPQQGFFRVLGAGGVAGGGADAFVLLFDEGFVVECLVAGVAPVFLAHVFVQAFGEGFGQAVGQGFEHDGVVVVVVGFEALHVFVDADAGGDGEGADVVFQAGVFGRDEVGQALVGAARRFLVLLAQVVQGGQHFAARFVGVDFDVVVVHLVGGEQAEHGFGLQPFFVDDLLQHVLRVFEQVLGVFADHFVFQDLRVAAGQFPGFEERGPVDVVAQFFQREVVVTR